MVPTRRRPLAVYRSRSTSMMRTIAEGCASLTFHVHLPAVASRGMLTALHCGCRKLARPLRARQVWRERRRLSTASDKNTGGPGEYCVQLVKQHDFDGYLCGLLMPTQSRRSYFALRAFNVETALVKASIRGNALPGHMRMQWWREVISGMYKGNVSQQPVAAALAQAVQDHKLTKRWLDRIVEARERDLDNIQPMTVADLEEYAEKTASSLTYLTLEALGIRDPHADHAASHVGKATGIVTLLRGTRSNASLNSLYIPVELQREYKVSAKDVLEGPRTPEAAQALADVLYEMASHAHVHMEHARHMLPQAPKGTYKALLPGVRTAMYLEALQKAKFNIFDESVEPRSHLTFQLRLFWANLRGKL